MTWRMSGSALLALALAAGPASGRGTGAGVYSEAQAITGAAVYARQCAMCHGAHLEGTVEIPGLTGKFVANWGGRPLGNLYDYLARAMPQSAPGSLQPQDNAALLAFILQANGAPVGTSALPADSRQLGRIRFDAPGPPD